MAWSSLLSSEELAELPDQADHSYMELCERTISDLTKELEASKSQWVEKTSVVDSKLVCVHSFGVIDKKGTSKITPISNCIQPECKSVNSFMESVQDKFHYVTVETIVSHIIEGNCYVMSTVDLASAYQYVMIKVSDRGYFGPR